MLHRPSGRLPSTAPHPRSRGQAVVIFALSIVLFVGLSAVVVDISWYWVNTLKVQRAADAAALAGAVYLPGDPTTAIAEARASAVQNGYTNGSGGVTVTPVQDSSDLRQLDVSIQAGVSTFFARAVGISSWPIARTAKGVYVLPVPMGSPLAYYGVGDFYVNETTSSTQPFSSVSQPGYTVVSGGPVDQSGPRLGQRLELQHRDDEQRCPAVGGLQHPQHPRRHARWLRGVVRRQGLHDEQRLQGASRRFLEQRQRGGRGTTRRPQARAPT